MDYLMGIKGPDFAMICTDTAAVNQIITIKNDEDKIVAIDSHKMFGVSGEPGDRVNFTEFIIANVKLYAMRNNTELTTKAVANFTRGELATNLRKSPVNANFLLAGWDKATGPSLYWMDYLATLNSVNTGGNGYGSMFVLSLFDKLWHPNLTQEEAVQMMEKGIEEVKRRLVVAPSTYVIKVVDANGVRTVKTVGGETAGGI